MSARWPNRSISRSFLAPSRRATPCDGVFSRSMQWTIAVDLESRKRPVDRRPRRLDRIALAAKLLRNAPADFEARPTRRKPRPHPADVFAATTFPRPRTCPQPCSAQCPAITAALRQPTSSLGNGLAVGGDEARRGGIGQHRRVRRDVGGHATAAESAARSRSRGRWLRQRGARLESERSSIAPSITSAVRPCRKPGRRGSCDYRRPRDSCYDRRKT